MNNDERKVLANALKRYHDCKFTPGVYEHSIIGQAALVLENEATKQMWIPVTERLPDRKKVIDGDVYYKNVAVRVKNLLHERVAYYDPEHQCWYDTGFFQLRGVTHWAELPDWGDFAE